MHVLETKILRGPNRWSVEHHQLIDVKIDIGEFEWLPTNKIDKFAEQLEQLLPSLIEHHCSEGRRGGFFERVREGTWIGHVIEHIALELQWLAGMEVSFGRTRSAEAEGVYHIVYAYHIEEAGLLAFESAVKIVKALRYNQIYNLADDISRLKQIHDQHALGVSTQSMVHAALKRNIPVRVLRECDLIVFGQGCYQKKIQGTIVDSTSFIGIELTDNKAITKRILRDEMIPVPAGTVVTAEGELFKTIAEVGFPLVVKPLNGNHGRGVTTNVRTYQDLVHAFHVAQQISEEVLVEKFIDGDDYRLLAVNYKLVAAAKRTPPFVYGDGSSTVEELVVKLNADHRRGDDHEKVLTRVHMDEAAIACLYDQGLSFVDIPKLGRRVWLKRTANISTGGSARDVTDEVHPYNRLLAERIARILNLDVCGIDLMAKDIKHPVTERTGAVIEVNASPGLRMHLAPSEGSPRDAGKYIVDMLYPAASRSRIPIIAVTGTNGKTTTTRLIAHLAKESHFHVGFTVTDGIYINNEQVFEGDCSGPRSAQVVLNDPTVDFAVLECARGGILRSGLGFDSCDVSVMTNISDDHLGMDGIHTLEAMTHVKSVVARSTRQEGYAVLNAEDENLVKLKDNLKCNVAWFAMDADNEVVRAHIKEGGLVCVAEDLSVQVIDHGKRIFIEKIADIPLTFGGAADCMIQNVLAAVLAAYAQGQSVEHIRNGLRTFVPSPSLTPGRMNIFELGDCKVMIDYGHNPGSFKAIKHFLDHYTPSFKIGIITAVGDRRDEDIVEVGRLSADMFDKIIIRLDKDLRGRDAASLVSLLQRGISLGNSSLKALVIPDEIEAISYCLHTAVRDSFTTVFTEHAADTCHYLLERQKSRQFKSRSVPSQSVAHHA